MKVIYDNETEKYLIINEETAIWVNTDDIVEARKLLLERITSQFNDAVAERLANK